MLTKVAERRENIFPYVCVFRNFTVLFVCFFCGAARKQENEKNVFHFPLGQFSVVSCVFAIASTVLTVLRMFFKDFHIHTARYTEISRLAQQ